jgi:hypothetical protein
MHCVYSKPQTRVKKALGDHPPHGGAVNGFSVDLQPAANLAQALLLDLGDTAVMLGPNVEQEVASIGNGAHKQPHQLLLCEVVLHTGIPA